MKHLIILTTFIVTTGLDAAAQTPATDIKTAIDSTAIADSLISRADTLNGVVVTAKEIVRYDDHLLL